jgi:Zn-dependent peptidase ImmA (M78 family)
MINDNFKKKYILPVLNSKKYTEEDKRVFIRRNFRLYSILLRPLDGLHRKGYVIHYNFGSIIVYNPRLDDKDIRVLIAHELGHIINLYLLNTQDTQNTANLFSFIAINGKNNFYKNEATGFTYTSELAIIDAISAACPILRHDQAADV